MFFLRPEEERGFGTLLVVAKKVVVVRSQHQQNPSRTLSQILQSGCDMRIRSGRDYIRLIDGKVRERVDRHVRDIGDQFASESEIRAWELEQAARESEKAPRVKVDWEAVHFWYNTVQHQLVVDALDTEGIERGMVVCMMVGGHEHNAVYIGEPVWRNAGFTHWSFAVLHADKIDLSGIAFEINHFEKRRLSYEGELDARYAKMRYEYLKTRRRKNREQEIDRALVELRGRGQVPDNIIFLPDRVREMRREQPVEYTQRAESVKEDKPMDVQEVEKPKRAYRRTPGVVYGRRRKHTGCVHPGCKREHYGRSFCEPCYRRNDRYRKAQGKTWEQYMREYHGGN